MMSDGKRLLVVFVLTVGGVLAVMVGLIALFVLRLNS